MINRYSQRFPHDLIYDKQNQRVLALVMASNQILPASSANQNKTPPTPYIPGVTVNVSHSTTSASYWNTAIYIYTHLTA